MRYNPIVLRQFCFVVVGVVIVVVVDVVFVVIVVRNVDVVVQVTSKIDLRLLVMGWGGGVGGCVQTHYRVKPNSVEVVLRLSWGCDKIGVLLRRCQSTTVYCKDDARTN